ncbi:unnamed protein product, partial [marine sediment metagenome]
SKGDFSVIKGIAKSRKTFLITMLLAAALRKKDMYAKFRNELRGENVLYFDTEQSRIYVKKVLRRIDYLADNELYTNNFISCSLRAISPSLRLKVIEYAIYNIPNIGYVVIDGIRDLIMDINSQEEATNISTKLLKWTCEKNIHITTVLHENKDGVYARGSIGSELVNKAETVLKIVKKKELSVISSEIVRGMPFEDIYFSINYDGIPELTKPSESEYF